MIKCTNECPLQRFSGCCHNCPEFDHCDEACEENPNACGEATFDEETGLAEFRATQLATLNAIASLSAHKKAIEEQEKQMKAALYEAKADLNHYKRKVIRHELIHAILFESGLSNNSWAENEELVDWIAIQFPKLEALFQQAGCNELLKEGA